MSLKPIIYWIFSNGRETEHCLKMCTDYSSLETNFQFQIFRFSDLFTQLMQALNEFLEILKITIEHKIIFLISESFQNPVISMIKNQPIYTRSKDQN